MAGSTMLSSVIHKGYQVLCEFLEQRYMKLCRKIGDLAGRHHSSLEELEL